MASQNTPLPPGLQVVVGLGKTGLSAARFLARQNLPVAVTDTRHDPPGLDPLRSEFPNLTLSLGQLDAQLCQQADRLIVSPGISLREPAIHAATQKGIVAIGDVELFAEQANAPIVAITGSNGKSTVTSLMAEISRIAGIAYQVGGNLGMPALELLDPQAALYILELSSFQLETTHSLNTQSAVVLNLSADHMDRYACLEDYLFAKQRIYRHCQYPIINRDDPITFRGLQLPNVVSFGLDTPEPGHFGVCDRDGVTYLCQGTQRLLPISQLKMRGKHQIANVLAAIALSDAIGLPMPAVLEALQTFAGLPHRCQWVGTYHGVSWYNDSKGTNVGAAKSAIEGIGGDCAGKLILIAGGLGKNADFTPLRETISRYARHVVLIGQDAHLLEAALAGDVPLSHADSMIDAVQLARAHAQSGDTVLLSPACASLDMFDNFEHRGVCFMDAVRDSYEHSLA